jgi:type IX secretion system PorP/SprF family membrane protein
MAIKEIYKLLHMAALMCIAAMGNAQVNNRYNLFYEELYAFNPAAANLSKNFSASLNANLLNAGAGFGNTPRTISLFVNGPFNEKTGLGIRVVSSTRGAFNTNNVLGSYSYKIKLGSDDHFLNMGLSAGMYWQSFEIGQINATYMDDNALTSSYYNKKYFLNEIGILYKWHNLLAGFSAPYVIQLYNQYFAHVSYNYAVPGADGFEISPNILYQYLPEHIHQVDISLKLKYNFVWAGYTYKTNNSMLTALGIIYKRYALCYSYEFNNKAFSVISNSSHEVMLRYNFNMQLKSRKASYSKDKMPWEEKKE